MYFLVNNIVEERHFLVNIVEERHFLVNIEERISWLT